MKYVLVSVIGTVLVGSAFMFSGNDENQNTKSAQEIVEKIKEEKKLLKYNIFEAQEKEKLFFTFTEMEMRFDNVEGLIGFCFDYMPSSVEILGEKEINVKREEIENVINDLLAKLHEYDMVLKNLRAELILTRKS